MFNPWRQVINHQFLDDNVKNFSFDQAKFNFDVGPDYPNYVFNKNGVDICAYFDPVIPVLYGKVKKTEQFIKLNAIGEPLKEIKAVNIQCKFRIENKWFPNPIFKVLGENDTNISLCGKLSNETLPDGTKYYNRYKITFFNELNPMLIPWNTGEWVNIEINWNRSGILDIYCNGKSYSVSNVQGGTNQNIKSLIIGKFRGYIKHFSLNVITEQSENEEILKLFNVNKEVPKELIINNKNQVEKTGNIIKSTQSVIAEIFINIESYFVLGKEDEIINEHDPDIFRARCHRTGTDQMKYLMGKKNIDIRRISDDLDFIFNKIKEKGINISVLKGLYNEQLDIIKSKKFEQQNQEIIDRLSTLQGIYDKHLK
jgi:hypothetical protein